MITINNLIYIIYKTLDNRVFIIIKRKVKLYQVIFNSYFKIEFLFIKINKLKNKQYIA